MNKEMFRDAIVKLCASALGSGVITLAQFNKYIDIMGDAPSFVKTKQRIYTKGPRRYTVKWNQERIEVAVELWINGHSYVAIARELEKRLGVRCTDRAVSSLIGNTKSGAIFKHEKYRNEPMRTFMVECQKALNAVQHQQLVK